MGIFEWRDCQCSLEPINSLSRWQDIRVPIASTPHQHLMLSDFLIFVSLTAMKGLEFECSVVEKGMAVNGGEWENQQPWQ